MEEVRQTILYIGKRKQYNDDSNSDDEEPETNPLYSTSQTATSE